MFGSQSIAWQTEGSEKATMVRWGMKKERVTSFWRKGISSYCVFKSVYSSIGPNKDVKVLFQKYVDTHAGSIHQTDRPDIMQLLCSCSITCMGLRVCVWGSGHFVNTHPILIYETLLTHFYNLHTHTHTHACSHYKSRFEWERESKGGGEKRMLIAGAKYWRRLEQENQTESEDGAELSLNIQPQVFIQSVSGE